MPDGLIMLVCQHTLVVRCVATDVLFSTNYPTQ